MEIRDIGLIDPTRFLDVQNDMVQKRLFGKIPDTILFLESTPAISFGKRPVEWQKKHILVPETELTRLGVKQVVMERGGNITLHLPGMISCVPIIKKPYRYFYIKMVGVLENAVIKLCNSYGIPARRHEAYRGVWAGEKKISSVGMRETGSFADGWVTSYGININNDPDASFFSLIRPCGIAGCVMTSLKQELGITIPRNEIIIRFSAELISLLSEI